MDRIRLRRPGKRAWLLILLGAFIAVVLFVNPLRETAMEDDWVYALTVRHLLDTGHYQLHVWAGANLPFQIYWGALFARLLGYSFSSLRISTLVLSLCGLLAFYGLAREHGLDEDQAGLLTLALLASPLVLRFSFNFMTDVPFLACLTIALYLYTRAIRLRSYPWMLAASLAACAAILTRQFGMALIGGLLALWACGKARAQQAPFFLVGLALPVVAALWQLYAGIVNPNWGAQYFTLVQAEYFSDLAAMLGSMLWRPSVILQYLALFSLPLLFVAVLAAARCGFSALSNRARQLVLALLVLAGLGLSALALLVEWLEIGQPGFGLEQRLMLVGGLGLSLASGWRLRWARRGKGPRPRQAEGGARDDSHGAGLSSGPSDKGMPSSSEKRASSPSEDGTPSWTREGVMLGVLGLYIVAGILYGHLVQGLPLSMPYLGYNFYGLESLGRLERAIVALVTSAGAVLLARMFVLRYAGVARHAERVREPRRQGWAGIAPPERLLDLVTLFLLLLQLIFAAISDQYLLVFLPFALIVTGRHLRDALRRYRLVALLACLAMLVASAMWTRGLLEYFQAYWQGGEFLLSRGVPAEQVAGSWTWVGHYRFDDFVAEAPQPTLESERDFFSRWLPEQKQRAPYWITETLDAPASEKWQVLRAIPYRDTLLRTRYVYVVRRETSSQ